MFENGVYALIICIVVFFIYGRIKHSTDKTTRLTRRLSDFKTSKLQYKKSGILYKIKHFFRIN